MSQLEILTEPNPILHEKCKKVKHFDDKLKKLAHDMTEKIFNERGTIGLAAPQVGELIQMIVVEFDPKKYLSEEEQENYHEKAIPLTILVNPKITWRSKEKEFADEGCMSLPDIELSIERHKEIHVIAENLDGQKIKIRAKDYFARVLQHEIDHLNGILITDHSKSKLSRIVFIGTPDFAAASLNRLIRSPFHPYLIITEPDRHQGRGQKIIFSPVKSIAEAHNIDIWQPDKIKNIKSEIEDLKPDLIVVAAYGQIIPKAIIDCAKLGAINVHPSLLPKYRGASPIQSVILSGEKKTGVTIMKMDEKMDHGPLLSQIEFKFDDKISANSLEQNLANIGANLLVRTIALYVSSQIKPFTQNHKKATYTKLIQKSDGKIDWNNAPEKIERKIRAYYPWPGAYTTINGKILKICQAHMNNDKIIIDRVQLEGKKEMSFDEFARGYHKPIDFLTKIK